jgi:hypothetical protein
MVDGLQRGGVVSTHVHTDGHADRHGSHFSRRYRGRKFDLGVDTYPGLLVVLLGGCGKVS